MKYHINMKSLLALGSTVIFAFCGFADKLVILHTNDTHSSIESFPDGTSGILQRKAIMDSIRNVEKNVITIDAGDAVQGSLFFKYFGGEVEYPLMNMSGYDIRILGNHEFDNGMASLAKYYKKVEGVPLSANYDFTGTGLEGIFKPYYVRTVDGKKIGFIGINIDPESIIAHNNFQGKFRDVITTANEVASYLKNEEKCNLVVVVSHIGYQTVNDKTSDIELAKASSDIDLIIGGHTHTLIDPQKPEINPSLIKNKNGKPVRVVQTGKNGVYIGKLTIDLENLPLTSGENIQYELIPVTDRFDEALLDQKMVEFLRPYLNSVDSVNNVIVAYCASDLEKSRTGGLPNLTADIAFEYGKEMVRNMKTGADVDDVDLAIMNVGGIRHDMPKGKITEGQVLSTYPFSNKFVLISIKGSDIIEALRISARKGGEAISENVRVVTDSQGELKRVVLDGKEMDPDEEYVVATIDYIAEGNDDLRSMANHKKLMISEEEVSIPILNWIKKQNQLGLQINPDPNSRFVIDVNEIQKQ